MKKRNLAAALAAAGIFATPGITSAQDDYTFQVEVSNKSKRLVYVGTGYKKAYKQINPGNRQTFSITISSSDCKIAKEFEVDISDTKNPPDSRSIYAYLSYLYEWNNGSCYFSYIGNKSVNDSFEIADDGEISAGGGNVTRAATFENKN